MVMFITVCAIIVIGIAVAVVVDRIIRTQDTQSDGGCWGCKHLDFWNDGTPMCTKSIDNICIQNGFKYRERNEE